jgi:hypothetical protein
VLAYKDSTGVRLLSRNGRELSRRFSELAAAMAEFEPPTLLLDGEIAVFDRQLISRFEWLRGRPKDDTATPPLLMAFDCLYAGGKDLRKRALRVRRNVLEEVVDAQQLVLPARRFAANGLEAWAQVLEHGYEGLVGKDEASPYTEGRTLCWLKVKQPKYREGERGWSRIGDAPRWLALVKAPPSRVSSGLPGAYGRARHPPEGKGPPSRGRPFGLYCCGLRGGGVGGSDGRRGAHEGCPQVEQNSPRLAKHCDQGCSHFSVLLQTSHIGAPRLA